MSMEAFETEINKPFKCKFTVIQIRSGTFCLYCLYLWELTSDEIQTNTTQASEKFMGENSYGIDPKRIKDYAQEIKQIHQKGVEVAIVIGGGNIFRGMAGSNDG